MQALTAPHNSLRFAPSLDELVGRAIADTDFLGDISLRTDLMKLAAGVADQVADQWEDEVGELRGALPRSSIEALRVWLLAYAEETLADAAEVAAAELADARDAGDLDADGEPIPFPTYRFAEAVGQ
jgi:hypothetical protein